MDPDKAKYIKRAVAVYPDLVATLNDLVAALKAIREVTNSDQDAETAASKASAIALEALTKIGED